MLRILTFLVQFYVFLTNALCVSSQPTFSPTVPIYQMDTIAGNGITGAASDGAVATSSSVNSPYGMYTDISDTYLYFCDGGNKQFRKINLDTGITMIFAGDGGTPGNTGDGGAATSAKFAASSYGVAGTTSGTIFISEYDSHDIRTISPSGIINRYAGIYTSGSAAATASNGDGGRATSATLKTPNLIRTDANNNLYITDTGNRKVRKINALTTVITTIAGTGGSGTTGDDGYATSATLNWLIDIFIDSVNQIYISDYSGNRIRMISSDNIITLFAGSGSVFAENVPATTTSISSAYGLWGDRSSGNIYYTAYGSSQRYLRMVSKFSGIVTNVASNGATAASLFVYGGLALSIPILSPRCLGGDSQGKVFVTDTGLTTGGNSIRGVTSSVSTTAAPTISSSPTAIPTSSTPVPSALPSILPTTKPSIIPTTVPSRVPSQTPTIVPSTSPSTAPSALPSATPSITPSVAPSATPSRTPTVVPAATPSTQPSALPSATPSIAPTIAPSAVPSVVPSTSPSVVPSVTPSITPSRTPSVVPSTQPSALPSATPSISPTAGPSAAPSLVPSVIPSISPTSAPSVVPSVVPSTTPSNTPSRVPTVVPTATPSTQPTAIPSVAPSFMPSTQPSVVPSPTPTIAPSRVPTVLPSAPPSNQPSMLPSAIPSISPTAGPSLVPSVVPSATPSNIPSRVPTVVPTATPSTQPSADPSISPTVLPSVVPTTSPSVVPTATPSIVPSRVATVVASAPPSPQPSVLPSAIPSISPTVVPSVVPSVLPSATPSNLSSRGPTVVPTATPSTQPSALPTATPSIAPTAVPSVVPSTLLSVVPSAVPSAVPSVMSSVLPSATPLNTPSRTPSVVPTATPSNPPSAPPSASPSVCPTAVPSMVPSAVPSMVPSAVPSVVPSVVPSEAPSATPSNLPAPTATPSNQSSVLPSVVPSISPTALPSVVPSITSSIVPAIVPTATPSISPSSPNLITLEPSLAIISGTVVPSALPSATPSATPSSELSTVSSAPPTVIPSAVPSVESTASPSSELTIVPNALPTVTPSAAPSVEPSASPSSEPTVVPSADPSELTVMPSAIQSAVPTPQLSCSPSTTPTQPLTVLKSKVPSIKPTGQPSNSSSSATPTLAPSTIKPTIHRSSGTFPTETGLSVILPPDSQNRNISVGVMVVLPFLRVTPATNSLAQQGFYDIDLSSRREVGTNYVVFVNRSPNRPIDLNTLSPKEGFYLSPAVSYDYSGRSVSNAGDINGDGYDDLIIGVPYAARCYVLFGTSQGFVNMTEGFTIFGQADSMIGWSVSGAGDVNNDTFSDIVTGAPYARDGNVGCGAAYVVYGKLSGFVNIHLETELPSAQGFTIYGATQSELLGLSVSSAGDVNGDEFDDVIIGALKATSSYRGGAYVVFGTNTSHDNIYLQLLTPSEGLAVIGPIWSYSGYSVSGAGDVNGDGFDDVMIGSVPFRTTFEVQKTYLIYGNNVTTTTTVILSDLSRQQGVVISGGGVVVSGVGDINHDGYDDIVIGSNYGFNGGSFITVAYRETLKAPTLLPTMGPTTSSPTFQPTKSKVPTRTPKLRPSRQPTMQHTGPSQPPTEAPTGPTSTPSSVPSISTEQQSNSIIWPTSRPSSQPSKGTSAPTLFPTTPPSESNKPTVAASNPSLRSKSPVFRVPSTPSQLPTMAHSPDIIVITTGGHYENRNDRSTNFIVNANEIVFIMGSGCSGGNTYTVLPQVNGSLHIEIFNNISDKLNLTSHSTVHSMSDLVITSGSVIITFPTNGQRIRLVNLTPLDISENNFMLNTPSSDKTSEESTNSRIIVVVISSTVVLSLLLFLVYQLYRRKVFNKLKYKDGIIALEDNPTRLVIAVNDMYAHFDTFIPGNSVESNTKIDNNIDKYDSNESKSNENSPLNSFEQQNHNNSSGATKQKKHIDSGIAMNILSNSSMSDYSYNNSDFYDSYQLESGDNKAHRSGSNSNDSSISSSSSKITNMSSIGKNSDNSHVSNNINSSSSNSNSNSNSNNSNGSINTSPSRLPTIKLHPNIRSHHSSRNSSRNSPQNSLQLSDFDVSTLSDQSV